MSTLNKIIKEVLFEEKTEELKIFYNIDVELIPKKVEPEQNITQEPEQDNSQEQNANQTKQESINDKNDNILLEAEKAFKQKIEGTISIQKKDAANIQTINDLIEFLSKEAYKKEAKQTSMEKILNKKKLVSAGKIINPIIKEIILILTNSSDGDKNIKDLISKDDKLIIEIKYGENEMDNIGFKINKTKGTEITSVTIVKDGGILPEKFNPILVNKQILFYRNSLI